MGATARRPRSFHLLQWERRSRADPAGICKRAVQGFLGTLCCSAPKAGCSERRGVCPAGMGVLPHLPIALTLPGELCMQLLLPRARHQGWAHGARAHGSHPACRCQAACPRPGERRRGSPQPGERQAFLVSLRAGLSDG